MNGAGGSPKDRVALSIIKSVNTSSRSYISVRKTRISNDVWGRWHRQKNKGF